MRIAEFAFAHAAPQKPAAAIRILANRWRYLGLDILNLSL
jgi:hypothetical protein